MVCILQKSARKFLEEMWMFSLGFEVDSVK